MPQAPFCHLGFQITNCPPGNWLIGQVAPGRSYAPFAAATAHGDTGKRSDRCGSRSRFRHRRATSWPAYWLVAMSLPRMTVVTACRIPIHRFAARKTLASAAPADKIRDGGSDCPSSRSPRPTRVSPLTVSGLVILVPEAHCSTRSPRQNGKDYVGTTNLGVRPQRLSLGRDARLLLRR